MKLQCCGTICPLEVILCFHIIFSCQCQEGLLQRKTEIGKVHYCFLQKYGLKKKETEAGLLQEPSMHAMVLYLTVCYSVG